MAHTCPSWTRPSCTHTPIVSQRCQHPNPPCQELSHETPCAWSPRVISLSADRPKCCQKSHQTHLGQAHPATPTPSTVTKVSWQPSPPRGRGHAATSPLPGVSPGPPRVRWHGDRPSQTPGTRSREVTPTPARCRGGSRELHTVGGTLASKPGIPHMARGLKGR